MIADRISSKAKLKSSGREVPEGWMSVDVGPKTLSNYEKLLKKAGVVFMHGPLGASDVLNSGPAQSACLSFSQNQVRGSSLQARISAISP